MSPSLRLFRSRSIIVPCLCLIAACRVSIEPNDLEPSEQDAGTAPSKLDGPSQHTPSTDPEMNEEDVEPPAADPGKKPKPDAGTTTHADQPTPMPKPDPAEPQSAPAKLAAPSVDSYEVSPRSASLTFHGTAPRGSTVTLYEDHSQCGSGIASAIVADDGTFSLSASDFRAQAQGFELKAVAGAQASDCRAFTNFFTMVEPTEPALVEPHFLGTAPASGTGATDFHLFFKADQDVDAILVFTDANGCSGDPAQVFEGADIPVYGDVGFSVPLHVEVDTTTTFYVATERAGLRSPCSQPKEYIQKSSADPSAASPMTETTISILIHEPGSLYGFQMAGKTSHGAGVKFFDADGCSGNDLTRLVEKFPDGSFTAWIDLPNDSHLTMLWIQTSRDDLVICEAYPTDISTSDAENLFIDTISRSRRDDASVDVTISGSAHAKQIEVYLSDDCTGDVVASTMVDSALPYPYSLTFQDDVYKSETASFLLTGQYGNQGLEQRCITRTQLLALPLSAAPLPTAGCSVSADKGDSLEFSVGFAGLPQGTNYYVNLSYSPNCTQEIFRGAPAANYYVTLPKPITAIYGYTVSEDFQRSVCTQLYSAAAQ